MINQVEDGIDNLKKEHNHTFKETDLKKKYKQFYFKQLICYFVMYIYDETLDWSFIMKLSF